MKQSSEPILSIGLIVRNETKTLERCLTSLQPLRNAIPCEVVIADTGSTDGTRELAARYADILFDFPWGDDFSAARNAVMDRCSGQWYLSLDADEYLDQDLSGLLSLLRKVDQKALFAMAYLRNYTKRHSDTEYADVLACRLARLKPEIRFVGTIHERWPIEAFSSSAYLIDQVLIHHTGYAYATPEDRQKKRDRNMKLLEERRKKEPENLMLVLQCLESADEKAEQIRYAYQGMNLLQRKVPCVSAASSSLVRTAIQTALNYDLPEFDAWVAFARAEYPDSIFTEVDVSFYLLVNSYNHKQYEDVLRYAKSYWQGLKRYDTKGYDPIELAYSSVYTSFHAKRDLANRLEREAYRYLGRWDSFLAELDRLLDGEITIDSLKEIFRTLVAAWNQVDLTARISKLYKKIYSFKSKRPELWSAFFQEGISYLLAASDGSFQRPYGLFSPLDCDLGRVSRILSGSNITDVKAAANDIEDWNKIPDQVVNKYLDWLLPFPDAFYQLPTERIHAFAQYVLKQPAPETSKKAVTWLRSVPEENHFPLERVLRYDLAFCALQLADWNVHHLDLVKDQEELLDLFRAQARAFLNWYYNPQLMEKTNVSALPSSHLAGWLLLRYGEAIEKGDYAQAVAHLRSLLKTVPALDSMVCCLLNRLERLERQHQVQNASPELLALSEQVRGLLSRFQPDDPAVIALKQSDVYQKVAYLIEGMDASTFGGLPQ